MTINPTNQAAAEITENVKIIHSAKNSHTASTYLHINPAFISKIVGKNGRSLHALRRTLLPNGMMRCNPKVSANIRNLIHKSEPRINFMIEAPNNEVGVQTVDDLVKVLEDYQEHSMTIDEGLIPQAIKASPENMAQMYSVLYKTLVETTKTNLTTLLPGALAIEKLKINENYKNTVQTKKIKTGTTTSYKTVYALPQQPMTLLTFWGAATRATILKTWLDNTVSKMKIVKVPVTGLSGAAERAVKFATSKSVRPGMEFQKSLHKIQLKAGNDTAKEVVEVITSGALWAENEEQKYVTFLKSIQTNLIVVEPTLLAEIRHLVGRSGRLVPGNDVLVTYPDGASKCVSGRPHEILVTSTRPEPIKRAVATITAKMAEIRNREEETIRMACFSMASEQLKAAVCDDICMQTGIESISFQQSSVCINGNPNAMQAVKDAVAQLNKCVFHKIVPDDGDTSLGVMIGKNGQHVNAIQTQENVHIDVTQSYHGHSISVLILPKYSCDPDKWATHAESIYDKLIQGNQHTIILGNDYPDLRLTENIRHILGKYHVRAHVYPIFKLVAREGQEEAAEKAAQEIREHMDKKMAKKKQAWAEKVIRRERNRGSESSVGSNKSSTRVDRKARKAGKAKAKALRDEESVKTKGRVKSKSQLAANIQSEIKNSD